MDFLIYDEVAAPLAEQLHALTGSSTKPDAINLRINSPGGDVFEGFAALSVLKDSGLPITATIDGLAASMASVLAASASKVVAAKGAMLMIHEPWTLAVGSANELKTQAAVLEKMRDQLADIYVAKSGVAKDEILRMMAAETWLTADEAKMLGLVDEVKLDQPASIDIAALAPHLARFKNTPKNLLSMPEAKLELVVEPETLPMPEAAVDIQALTSQVSQLTAKVSALAAAVSEKEAAIVALSTENTGLKESSRAADKAQAIIDAKREGKWVPALDGYAASRSLEDVVALIGCLPVMLGKAEQPAQTPETDESAELMAPPKSPQWALESGYYDRRAALRRERPELFEQENSPAR